MAIIDFLVTQVKGCLFIYTRAYLHPRTHPHVRTRTNTYTHAHILTHACTHAYARTYVRTLSRDRVKELSIFTSGNGTSCHVGCNTSTNTGKYFQSTEYRYNLDQLDQKPPISISFTVTILQQQKSNPIPFDVKQKYPSYTNIYNITSHTGLGNMMLRCTLKIPPGQRISCQEALIP